MVRVTLGCAVTRSFLLFPATSRAPLVYTADDADADESIKFASCIMLSCAPDMLNAVCLTELCIKQD